MRMARDADGVKNPQPAPSSDFLTTHDVAALVGCHERTIRRMVSDGRLKAFRLAGRIRIRQHDFDAMIANAIAEGVAPVGQVRAARLADLADGDHEGEAR